MTAPVYQILTYTGAALDHTITSDAINIYTKDVLTDGVGVFTFSLPATANGTWLYQDIALGDTVKIYFGYGTVDATASFIGTVKKIVGSVDARAGYIRTISGLSQGEVLLRRLKTGEYYNAENASDIIEALCDDLSLGKGSVEADVTDITMEVRSRTTYFDLVRKISDYWYSAGTQVKKDFYVDVSNNLIWCARDGTSPFRSGSSVETFTVGLNIVDYQVVKDLSQMANNITVKGSATASLPRSKDSWTDDENGTSGWTLDTGDTLAANGAAKVGDVSIYADTGAAADIVKLRYTLPQTVTIESIDTVSCWRDIEDSVGADGPELRLYAPDDTNYFYTYLDSTIDWVFKNLTLGPSNTNEGGEDTDGEWNEQGSPNWWDIQEVCFYMDFTFDNRWFLVDALHFSHDRWSDTASDAASQASYGRYDLYVINNKLHSDEACESAAETLLYQRKDPPTQITLTVLGNTNVLLGDRLSMTLPAEGISATNYDVTAVEHSYSEKGFMTRATMMDSGNIRKSVPTTPRDAISDLRRQVRLITDDERLT